MTIGITIAWPQTPKYSCWPHLDCKHWIHQTLRLYLKLIKIKIIKFINFPTDQLFPILLLVSPFLTFEYSFGFLVEGFNEWTLHQEWCCWFFWDFYSFQKCSNWPLAICFLKDSLVSLFLSDFWINKFCLKNWPLQLCFKRYWE